MGWCGIWPCGGLCALVQAPVVVYVGVVSGPVVVCVPLCKRLWWSTWVWYLALWWFVCRCASACGGLRGCGIWPCGGLCAVVQAPVVVYVGVVSRPVVVCVPLCKRLWWPTWVRYLALWWFVCRCQAPVVYVGVVSRPVVVCLPLCK